MGTHQDLAPPPPPAFRDGQRYRPPSGGPGPASLLKRHGQRKRSINSESLLGRAPVGFPRHLVVEALAHRWGVMLGLEIAQAPVRQANCFVIPTDIEFSAGRTTDLERVATLVAHLISPIRFRQSGFIRQ
jgi:hypothetical protein